MMGQAYYMENNMMGQGYMENNMMGQSYMENTEADACGDFFDELLLDFPNEDIQGGDLGGFEGCFPAAGDVDALSGSSLSANSGDSTCSVEVDFAAGLSVPVSFPGKLLPFLFGCGENVFSSLPKIIMDFGRVHCVSTALSSALSSFQKPLGNNWNR